MWMFNENTVFHIIAGIGVLHLWSFGWKPSSTYDSGKKNVSLSYIFNKGGSCFSLETRLDYLLILCVKSYLTLLISSWVSRQAFGTIEILTDTLAQLHELKLKPQTLWHHNLSMPTFSIHWYLWCRLVFVLQLMAVPTDECHAFFSGLQILGRCWGSSELWICSHSL